jgi:hypothetical protein
LEYFIVFFSDFQLKGVQLFDLLFEGFVESAELLNEPAMPIVLSLLELPSNILFLFLVLRVLVFELESEQINLLL